MVQRLSGLWCLLHAGEIPQQQVKGLLICVVVFPLGEVANIALSTDIRCPSICIPPLNVGSGDYQRGSAVSHHPTSFVTMASPLADLPNPSCHLLKSMGFCLT